MKSENFKKIHQPVLLKEVIKYLDPKPGEKIIDATFGCGGHSLKIREKILPGGKILGLEIDKNLYQEAKPIFKNIPEILLINGSYVDIFEIAKENKFLPAQGILFDLGLSSWHLEYSRRGFSYLKDERLDMRFGENSKWRKTAEEILNKARGEEIAKILKEYGEEKFSLRIAKAIVKARKLKPIETTFQLVKIIKEALPFWYHPKRHFAAKTFQALRIAVNNELENLEIALKQIPKILSSQGRGVVISFHSLEDRIVKNIFKELKIKGIAEILTKKPIKPTKEEIIKNPRSRSAKLRAIRVINNQTIKP